MRELVYYVAVTVDGFIADPDGNFGFFPTEGDHMAGLIAEFPETFPVHLREPLGIDRPNQRFDTVVMGRRTYQPALDAGLTSAYPHLAQYVVSRTLVAVDDPTVTVVANDPATFVNDLKRRDGMGIWLCGGSILAGALLPQIDELILKVNPTVIGAGRPLFAQQFQPHPFTLVASQTYDSGVSVMRYRR